MKTSTRAMRLARESCSCNIKTMGSMNIIISPKEFKALELITSAGPLTVQEPFAGGFRCGLY